MAKGNAIAAAVLASSGNPGTGGSGPSVPGGLSPLVASYSQQYSVNRPYSPLPRPVATFLEGAFGPFSPIQSMPIDPPREDTGRPDDRRFQYPVGWNLIQEPGTEGFRLTPYPVMRSLANSYSVARACIDKRKQEILGLLKNADVVPTADAEHAMMGDDKLRADFEKRRAIVLDFFSHPDSDRSKYPTLKAWLSAILEDRFVIDAVAVHLVPPRRRGSGPFGSDAASLDILDGAMIRPMLNTLGATPKPPAVGFQAYVWGVPRTDMMSVITEADLEDMDEPAAEYRADQLIYMREEPRAFTPYGFSCIEKALLPINIGLARQQFQSDYFAEGSVPAMFVVPGPDISTPQQIRQLQDAMNAMAGDIGAKHRIIVLPAGSKADPQKPVPLADQFDEWIISQVAMPFDLTPMDLGVTPRVSAVQSPSESRELSQINSDKGSQTRIEPVCEDLKSVLFDFVIQDVFGQKDMEWSFGLTDRGKNRQALIDQGVQLVQFGGKSVDELRVDLGDTPWGLPETSVPLWGTQMGPVPLSSIAAAPGAAPALPAGQQQLPAPAPADVQRAKQVTDEELTTPAHEAAEKLPDTPGDENGAVKQAAVKAELEILGRYLRKGRDLSRFTAQALPPEALEAAAKALPMGPAAAVKAAQDKTDAKRRQERRDRALEAAAAVVAAKLGNLVNGHKAGRISTAQLVDSAVMVLAAAYLTAILAGTRDASGDYDDTPAMEDGAQSAANQEALGQQGYLTGFLQDVVGGLSAAKIAQRLSLYAATLWRAYNRSYGNTVMTAHPDYVIVWELGDNTDHCAPCVERDGKEFTLETLPGWPGDGGFGGASSGVAGALGQENICDGGPRCHCSVSFIQNGKTLAVGTNTQLPWSKSYYAQQNATITAARQQAQAAREAFTASLPPSAGLRAMTRDQLRQQVADLANERIRASGGYSGISVEPQDIPARIIAQMLPPGLEGAAGLSLPQVNVAEAVEQMFAAKASLAMLDMTKAEFAAILKNTLADIARTGTALTGPKADPRKVYGQLAENYEPRGIQWVLRTRWIGPVDIPADMVDTSSEDSWAASEPGPNTDHVERFEHRIQAGDDVNPAVLVQVPGGGKLKDVDGHHRYRAYRNLGKPVKAYVGFPGDDTAWRETHSFQVHAGGDPMNKQAGDEDPTRVAFLLIRAPNEAGKWRYLLQKRDDESWGLPGGKSHEGEAPWAAAVREATEEMGGLPSVTPAAVWTRAEDDHVVFTYLADLPEMFTPSADGATSDETAGWGWFRKRDVAGLNLHPAMRETWGRLDFAKPRLGGEPVPAGAAKAGEDFQDRGEQARQEAGIDGTAGDSQDVPHRFTPDRDGDPRSCLACGLERVASVHDTVACDCCAPGTGEQPTGHECYRCDASGYLEGAEKDRPFCEEVFRNPVVHAAGCPHCGAAKAASGYQLSPGSGMISLDLPEGLVPRVPGGVTDTQHITVAYLGKGLTDADFAEACRRASIAAAAVPGPLNGVISGRGLFEPSDSSDGKTVVWAGVTLPGAEQLREALADLSASQFTDWHPHVTLAYIDAGDDLPDPVAPTPVTFTHVSVHRGDDVARFPLGGD